jgi:hypothetical protein
MEILAEKLGVTREALSLTFHPFKQFHWSTADQYRRDLEAFAAYHRHRFEELLSSLVRHGKLTQEQSDRCRLNLDIAVQDYRSSPKEALPTVGVGDHPKK